MTDSNASERIALTIHAGSAADGAVLTEWWHPLDEEVESRSLRFYSDSSNWLDEDQLPDGLLAAGCRITEVVSVENYSGLADPSIEVGRRLHLQPEPKNPYDPNAIRVLAEDKTTQIGYLPKEVAAETIAESHRLRSAYGAMIVAESRNIESGERTAIKILMGPGKVWATTA